jgi:hypothetical protein
MLGSPPPLSAQVALLTISSKSPFSTFVENNINNETPPTPE